MTLPRRRRWRTRDVLALLIVLLLHLAAWVVLRHSAGAAARRESLTEPSRISVRLLPWPTTPSARAEPQRPRTDAPRGPAPITPKRPADAVPPNANATASITAPAEPTLAAEPPALPASQPPRPLDLNLPRGYAVRPGARNPATADPRANTTQPTPEARMARTFDTQVTEEVMDDGRRRFRQGDKCVIVTPSRTTQLMPFSESAARIPSMASACP
jgi:hypothetical protein